MKILIKNNNGHENSEHLKHMDKKIRVISVKKKYSLVPHWNMIRNLKFVNQLYLNFVLFNEGWIQHW